jgi:hypothetical protein
MTTNCEPAVHCLWLCRELAGCTAFRPGPGGIFPVSQVNLCAFFPVVPARRSSWLYGQRSGLRADLVTNGERYRRAWLGCELRGQGGI